MTATQTLVTPDAVLVLDAETIRADRQLWLAERRKGIGSSDIPAILDLDDAYVTAVHVWHDKLGHDVDNAGEPALWGTLLEDVVAQEWCRRNRSVIEDMGLIAHLDHPEHLASLDRRVRECPLDRSHRIECGLEVKCRSAFKSHRWHADVPDDVLAQTMWQMWVSGFRHMHYAVLIGGNDYRQGVVHWDQAVASYVLGEVDRFWEINVRGGIEPEWNLAKAQRLIDLDEQLHPDRVGEIDVPGMGDVMEYAELSARKSAIEKELKVARARLAQLADGHRYVKFANELAFSLNPQTRTSVDLEVLAERFPDAYAACVRQTTSSVLRLGKAFQRKDIA